MAARSPFDTDERRQARGQRIRWAREIVEPNRLDFARKLGVDAATIRDIENGRISPNEWSAEMPVVAADYCPCCEREAEPYDSEALLEDVGAEEDA
jgi:DNA-binding XRE family transcriptional regulator